MKVVAERQEAPEHVEPNTRRQDRVAAGKGARADVPLAAHAEFSPGPNVTRSGYSWSRQPPGCPSWYRSRHGRMLVSPFTFYRGAALPMAAGPGDDTDVRAEGAAVRRRAPGQLRGVRVTRATARLRSQRLRRDAARLVRVGRQTARGELRGRRTRQVLQTQGDPEDRPEVGRRRTAPPCASSPSSPCWPSGTRTSTSRTPWPPSSRR